MLTLALVQRAAASPLFAAKFLPTQVGIQPFSLAAGDFNGDGRLDLAVAAAGSNAIVVLLGDGEGEFAPPMSYPLPRPFSVATGDFNGDGRLDLVATNSQAQTVSVLLGHGDGTFAPAAPYPVGLTPLSVAVGDFNRDGRLDVVTANGSSDSVSVLLGNGDGSLGVRSDYATGDFPNQVVVTDLDGDGAPDLVVANAGDHSVSVLRGLGDGTFAPKVDYPTPVGPYSVAGPYALVAGDLNGDGHPDVVVANYGSRTVSVLLGSGSGTLAPPVDYSTAPTPGSVTIGDVNGDGRPDLAVAGYASNTLTVLLGQGDGTFPTRLDTELDSGPTGVVIADFNRDGMADAVVTHYNVGSIWLLLGNGNGTFGGQKKFATGLAPAGVAVGDLNRDGKPDVVAACRSANAISVLFGDGLGQLGSRQDYATEQLPEKVEVGDLNEDGRSDLVVTSPQANTTSVFLASGAEGAFGARVDYPASSNVPPILGDFNNDGHLDVVLMSGPDVPPDSSTFAVLPGRGDGTFLPALKTVFQGYGGGPMVAGDFNRDGILDVALRSTGGVRVFLGNANGTFQNPATYPTGSPYDLVAGDLNGDGVPDLVAVGSGFQFVSVLIARGDGTFQPAVDYPAGDTPVYAAIGDINGDGRNDIVVTDAVEYPGKWTVSVLLNDGAGHFSTRKTYGTDNLVSGAPRLGDFNRDGKLDIVFPVGAMSIVEELLNTSSGGGSTPVLISADPPVVSAAEVQLKWRLQGDVPEATVWRSIGGEARTAVAGVRPDAHGVVTYRDRDVVVGGRYGYRIVIGGPGGATGGEVWATVPAAPLLSLEGATPNPSAGPPRVSFSLPDGSAAELVLIDVAGRSVVSRQVGSLGAGSHLLTLSGATIQPGVYWLRLSRQHQTLLRKVVLIR